MYRPRVCDSIKVDRELTAQRHASGEYSDPRSVIHQDGKEYLFGIDKEARRHQIWDRDKRRCVLCHTPVTWEQMEMHHRAKNYGGPRFDNLSNLETLCRDCHRGKNGKHA